jgi:hypothetical protein
LQFSIENWPIVTGCPVCPETLNKVNYDVPYGRQSSIRLRQRLLAHSATFGTGLADVNANVGLFFAVGFQNRLGYGFSFTLRAIA